MFIFLLWNKRRIEGQIPPVKGKNNDTIRRNIWKNLDILRGILKEGDATLWRYMTVRRI
jgi:hypothetical protein